MDNDKSNKKKARVVIQSFGEPAPEGVVEAAKELSAILDKAVRDYGESQKTLTGIRTFREEMSLTKTLSDSVIEKLGKLSKHIGEFLQNNPKDEISGEDFAMLIFAADLISNSTNNVTNMLIDISDSLMSLAVNTILGNKITYGELLDSEHIDIEEDD